MNPVYKPNHPHSEPISAAIPDPWFLAAQAAEPLVASWQFPLDPSHELTSRPAPSILTGEDIPGTMLLAEPPYSENRAIAFLVEEALKLPAVTAGHLRDAIRDAIAYLELLELTPT